MQLETLSKEQEKQIFGAITEAIKKANAGMDPSEALAKSASAANLQPEMACRMVEAYNTSKTLGLLKAKTGMDKLAEFPLADASKVLSFMYPDKVEAPQTKQAQAIVGLPTSVLTKSASHSKLAVCNGCGEMFDAASDAACPECKQPQSTEKRSEHWEDPAMLSLAIRAIQHDLEKQAKAAQLDEQEASQAVHELFEKLAFYFRTQDHEPFHEVDAVVRGHWGPEGEEIMNIAHGILKGSGFRMRRADKIEPTIAPNEAPYTIVKDLVKASHAYAFKTQATATVEKDLKDVRTRVEMFRTKSAALGDMALGGMLEHQWARAMEASPKSKSDVITGQLGQIADPKFESQRRAIDAQLDLHALMTGDPVISSHPKAKVLEAYNQLSASYPNMVQSPLVLQTYLRKLLEGAGTLDPYDLTAAAEIEKEVRKGNQPDGMPMKSDKD